MLCGGDFRQILAVILNGGAAEIINASLNRSELWSNFQVLRLYTNMRVGRLQDQDAAEAQGFSDWLRDLGDDNLPHHDVPGVGETLIHLPPDLVCNTSNIQDLIREVYGGYLRTATEVEKVDYLIKHCIVTPTNEVRRGR